MRRGYTNYSTKHREREHTLDNLKFRLKVHKLKCIGCDLIFLVEYFNNQHISTKYSCPRCCSTILVHKLDEIKIVQEACQNEFS